MSKRSILVVASDRATEADVQNAASTLRLSPDNHQIMMSARHGSIASIQNVIGPKAFQMAVVDAGEQILEWPDAAVFVVHPDDILMVEFAEKADEIGLKSSVFLAMGEFDKELYQ